MPAGAYKINFEIKQVGVEGAAGAKKITVVGRIVTDGRASTLNATRLLLDNLDATTGQIGANWSHTGWRVFTFPSNLLR